MSLAFSPLPLSPFLLKALTATATGPDPAMHQLNVRMILTDIRSSAAALVRRGDGQDSKTAFATACRAKARMLAVYEEILKCLEARA